MYCLTYSERIFSLFCRAISTESGFTNLSCHRKTKPWCYVQGPIAEIVLNDSESKHLMAPMRSRNTCAVINLK